MKPPIGFKDALARRRQKAKSKMQTKRHTANTVMVIESGNPVLLLLDSAGVWSDVGFGVVVVVSVRLQMLPQLLNIPF